MSNEQEVRLTFRIDVVVRVSVEEADGTNPGIYILPPVNPPVLLDCRVCGKSDNECREIINATGASRSCCGTCNNTATHGQNC